jgi:Ca-activated chloride channel family protein
MHIQTDRALIPASPSVRYLQVRVSAPSAPAKAGDPRPPTDVALVLDRSGSMGGSKFSMARTAVQHAIRLLAPTDALAVVCYDDRVDTLLGRTLASAEAKALALDRLAVTDARGATDLPAAGCRAPRNFGSRIDTRKRVLLLTDGLPIVGSPTG